MRQNRNEKGLHDYGSRSCPLRTLWTRDDHELDSRVHEQARGDQRRDRNSVPISPHQLLRRAKYRWRRNLPGSSGNHHYVYRIQETDPGINHPSSLGTGSDSSDPSLQSLEDTCRAWVSVPKLKFSKDYLQRLTKPIPKRDPNKRAEASIETFSEPRHPTGFHQYCTNCGKDQLFSVDTLGWKTCTVCRVTAPDRSQSPI
jgi:hypothetical protein